MVKPDPDSDLLPGLRVGDETALATLLDRHLNTVTALGYYMLADASLAEDVAQSTFLKLWQIAPKWKPGQASLLTWMRRVATNDCLDRLRKKGPIYSDHVPDRADDHDSALERLEKNETIEAVRRALAELPARQRAAITLSYYQQLSQKDGAAILEQSVKSYESLLSRARKNLKAALSALVERETI